MDPEDEYEFDDDFEEVGEEGKVESEACPKSSQQEDTSGTGERTNKLPSEEAPTEDFLGLDFGDWDAARSHVGTSVAVSREEFGDFAAANEEWDDEAWEEVEEPPVEQTSHEAPRNPVVIVTMTGKEPSVKRRKFTGLTRQQRIELIVSHRVTLLAWVGVLLRLNRLCSSGLVQALLLSHTPSSVSGKFPLRHRPGGKEPTAVKTLLEWWNKVFRVLSSSLCPLCNTTSDPEADLRGSLLEHAANLTGCRDMKWALLVALGRCIGLPTRLVLQLQAPISRKPTGKAGFVRLWCEYQTPADGGWVAFPEHSGQRPVVEAGRAQSPLDYVLGVSAEGVEDVTAAYVTDFLSRHHRLRQRFVGASGCEDWERGWWRSVLQLLGNIRTKAAQHHIQEKMPTTLAGFKSHPLLVLERHIPKNCILTPGTSHVGLFKGEKVFPRSALAALKSKQAWWLLGREVLPKHLDPATVLYPDYQTRVYSAPLLAGEKIPRNKHGTFDLFQPSMLPADAAHVTTPEAGSVARRLGLDYARAVVGFQHGAAGALPIENGIVLSKEDASLLQDALTAHHSSALERETQKRYTAAIRNWKAYIRFLEIKLRLQEEYGE